MEIQYYHRQKGQLETEKIYGDGAVRWLYQTGSGRAASHLLVRPWISKLYGALQESSWISKRKIRPFIQNFQIQMDEYLPTEGRTSEDPYASFNEFFIRRFREGARSFAEGNIFPAPCEARYFAFEKNSAELTIPVKGNFLSPNALLGKTEYTSAFENGPVVVARLCPVDYHRYHYPDDGSTLSTYKIPGVLHSVNPIALKEQPEVFMINERQVSILETKTFGKLAYIEVGAICVGKIVQSHQDKTFARGQEKGYFLFGGSTVILLGEPGRWRPSQDLLDWSAKGTEVYLKLGEPMGQRLSSD